MIAFEIVWRLIPLNSAIFETSPLCFNLCHFFNTLVSIVIFYDC